MTLCKVNNYLDSLSLQHHCSVLKRAALKPKDCFPSRWKAKGLMLALYHLHLVHVHIFVLT